MKEADECWQFQAGGRRYPEECVLVKFFYVPDRNGTDMSVWGGKRTVIVASSLSFMWSPKDTAQLITCSCQCVSEVVAVQKSDSWSVTKDFRNRPCLDMLIYSNNLMGCR